MGGYNIGRLEREKERSRGLRWWGIREKGYKGGIIERDKYVEGERGDIV